MVLHVMPIDKEAVDGRRKQVKMTRSTVDALIMIQFVC